MDCSAQFIDYTQTGYFSKMITDYISGNTSLKPFYENPVSVEGIKAAIDNRKKTTTNRELLVSVLIEQYSSIDLTAKQQLYLQQLKDENTFTITTAHQPNIFTGHLYFIYKILHTIKLANTLKEKFPENNFVPVYYMGSEDADLDELGHIYIDGEKFEWQTKQTGAVGRMIIDDTFVKLIHQFEGQVVVFPYGNEIIELVKATYAKGKTIEQATFQFVNSLFAEYGLLIVLPDNAKLKTAFIPVIEKELKEQFSQKAVEETIKGFPTEYKQQAAGRELNLFYLIDDKRERIELEDLPAGRQNSKFKIQNLKLEFSESQIIEELQNHPERFSPNVILRPVFQETILPNIAFIGGGGEIAYWLELKKVFEKTNIPFPVLVVRNSFMIIRKDIEAILKKLNFCHHTIFKAEQDLLTEIVKRESQLQLSLEKERHALQNIYQQIKTISGNVDVTLQSHTEALYTQALKKINTLEKKILKAEKKKFEAEQRQLAKAKKTLFPLNNLQERVDNFIPYYARWGSNFIDAIYKNSLSLEQQFGILTEKQFD